MYSYKLFNLLFSVFLLSFVLITLNNYSNEFNHLSKPLSLSYSSMTTKSFPMFIKCDESASSQSLNEEVSDNESIPNDEQEKKPSDNQNVEEFENDLVSSSPEKINKTLQDQADGEELEKVNIVEDVTTKKENSKTEAPTEILNSENPSDEEMIERKNIASQFSKSKPTEIHVPKSIIKYKLEPKVISKNKIIFLNAQNETFYERRTLKNPSKTVWIIVSTKKFGLDYAVKRFYETSQLINIQVHIYETYQIDLVITQEGLKDILVDGERVKDLPDAVIPFFGFNSDYYGLALLRQFYEMDVLVLNTHESLEIARDKLYTIQQLALNDLPVPKTVIARFPFDWKAIQQINFQYPLILKKSSSRMGKGVMLIRDENALADMNNMVDQSQTFVFQEYIHDSFGKDIRVLVVGGKVIGAMMRVAKKSFKFNEAIGGYIKPVKLSPQIEYLAMEAAKVMKLDFVSIELLVHKNTYKIIDIDASPDFETFELSTGIDVPKKVFDLINFRKLYSTKEVNAKPTSITKKKESTILIKADYLIPVKGRVVKKTK